MKLLKMLMTGSVIFCLSSCLNEIDESGFIPVDPQISFDRESENVANTASTVTLTLTSNLPWRISSDAAWATLSQSYGDESTEITVTIAKNRLREERIANITAYITPDSKTTFVLSQAAAEASEPITYYVKANGDGISTGETWETATTLATALSLAGDGDTILLGAGQYSPVALLTGAKGDDECEKTFEIHSNFAIIGGYPADATTGAECDPAANETILSGDLGNGKAAYHVLAVTSAPVSGQKAQLKNLTITGGSGKTVAGTFTSGLEQAYGGAMIVAKKAVVDLENCTIKENRAFHAAGAYLCQGSIVTYKDCTFSNNEAMHNAGAIWNVGSTLTMYDCTIKNNISGQQASGLYSIDETYEYVSVNRIYNCSFYGNDNTKTMEKRSGAGAYIRAYSDAIFVNCTFTENKAGWGAGIALHGQNSSKIADCTVINCTITGNSANNAGGAISLYNTNVSLKVYNSILTGNTGPGGPEDIGFNSGTEAQVTVKSSIRSGAVIGYEGTTISGAFDPTTMLGTFGLYGAGKTMCYPLIDMPANPAIANGMTVEQLKEMVAGANPAVDESYLFADQTGASRTGASSMGACMVK